MTQIVLVDDDITNIELIKMLLELDGFSVSACTDIEQATATAQTTPVDAFIIDHNLSRTENGLDLLQSIRAGQTGVHKSTPVIMTSGVDRRSDEALAAGANTFLLKPYPPTTLTETLQMLLEKGVSYG